MRTYSRKRPVYQAIKGVSELCRLCLGRDEVSVPIFDDADQLCAALSLRIMICVGLEMTRDSDLPNAICVECYKQLEQCYTFRKKCEVTYQKLKAHVLAMKGRHLNPTAMKTTEAADSEPSPVESNEQEQLVLTYDEAQQMQLLNLVNSNSVQLDTTENIIYDTATLEVLSNELEKSTCDEVNTVTVDESIPNPSTTPLEIEESTSDLSLIMSTMLLELGVLGQEGEGLILADEGLRTVELEGADNTKVILQLVEEDEEEKDVPVEINKKTIEVEPLYTLTLLKEGIIKSNKARQQASKTSKTSKEKGTKSEEASVRVHAMPEELHAARRARAARAQARAAARARARVAQLSRLRQSLPLRLRPEPAHAGAHGTALPLRHVRPGLLRSKRVAATRAETPHPPRGDHAPSAAGLRRIRSSEVHQPPPPRPCLSPRRRRTKVTGAKRNLKVHQQPRPSTPAQD